MKTRALIQLSLALLAGLTARAQKGTLVFPPPGPTNPPAPPPVYLAQPAPPAASFPTSGPSTVYRYDQKPAASRPTLLTADQAQGIINQFKAAYSNMGSPRLLIYVNRELVANHPGMKIVERTQQTETTQNAAGTNPVSVVKNVEHNTYKAAGDSSPSLADRQTVRDVERLFGRPLREAGATLVDQKVAAQLIADKPASEWLGAADSPEARKDREALGRIADLVIEVLISSKTVTVPTLAGTQTLTIPDIQATAVRLKDSKIMGQASSTDVFGRVPPAMLGNFDVHEVTEATALALMEDMTSK